MSETATLNYDGKSYEFPVLTGAENEKAIDISALRKSTGLITMDYGYLNTGSTRSQITFVDGTKGILRYRGYNIDELAANATFPETAWLLIYGELPTQEQLRRFRQMLTENALIHENLLSFFREMPPTAHPMGILSSIVNALGLFTPRFYDDENKAEAFNFTVASLISKVRTIAAFSYKASIGEPFVYPEAEMSYCANFLNMMFSSKAKPYDVDPLMVQALNVLFIVHADHEQNCSTSTVRIVGSSMANIYASGAAGVGALSGPLHGGANEAVLAMLEDIRATGMSVQEFVNKVKNKEAGIRLMGFGHRVYKNYDPRAAIVKKSAHDVLTKLGCNNQLLDIAMELEDIALHDDYFVERKLYPNVDFYTGLIYKAMGFPEKMFTVLFAIGRLPGWIAQWKEMRENKEPIGRPRQIYTGPTHRDFVALDQR